MYLMMMFLFINMRHLAFMKVRAGDGLLQRCIEKTKRALTFQGDMRRYWNLGNNQTFVYLIYLLKRRAVSGEASMLSDTARDFFQSFENRAKRTWESVSAPYRKATKEELNEFIAEDYVEEYDMQPHFGIHQELNAMDPADEIADVLRQRRLSQGGQPDSEDSSVEEGENEENESHAESDEDEANPDNIPGYYSEEEEEEDDWVTSKLARRSRRNKVSPSTSNKLPAAKGKRLGKARDSMKQDGQLKQDHSSLRDTKPPPTKKAKHSRIILESDSDE